MKTLLLRSSLILLAIVIASGAFFEWVLLNLIPPQNDPSASLDDAFVVSLAFDLVLVLAGSMALSWPLYRRLLSLQKVVERQQNGELQARANFGGTDTIAQLANSFDRLADTNAEHLENHRALLRAVSHELRTPVARLRFAVSALARAAQDQRTKLRESADTDIDELDALIEEILTYSRVSAGGAPRELETFELNALIEQIRSAHPGSVLHIQAPTPIFVHGEPRLIHRALSNLVRNAVHHAKTQVTIVVECRPELCIVVQDDGPGLPSHADERLFLPFVRYGSDGVGLGTSIAFAIAQRHGGSLTFTPEPSQGGAEFKLCLPAELLVPDPYASSSISP